MGINVTSFEMLLMPFSIVQDIQTIYRDNFNPHCAPQPHCCSLDAAGGLHLILHWLSSTMPGFSLQQIFSITPAVCTRDLQHGRSCLLRVLRALHVSQISWPSSESQCRGFSNLIEKKFPRLTKCFAFIDGLKIPVNVAEDDESIISCISKC